MAFLLRANKTEPQKGKNLFVNSSFLISAYRSIGFSDFLSILSDSRVFDLWESACNVPYGGQGLTSLGSLESAGVRQYRCRYQGIADSNLQGGELIAPMVYTFTGYEISHLSGQTVTISFDINTTWTGNFPVSLWVAGRSICKLISVTTGDNSVAVSFDLETFSIAATDTGTQMQVTFGGMAKGDRMATVEQWGNGLFVDFVGSNHYQLENIWKISKPKFEVGSEATEYEIETTAEYGYSKQLSANRFDSRLPVIEA